MRKKDPAKAIVGYQITVDRNVCQPGVAFCIVDRHVQFYGAPPKGAEIQILGLTVDPVHTRVRYNKGDGRKRWFALP